LSGGAYGEMSVPVPGGNCRVEGNYKEHRHRPPRSSG
jgi:hypothetical protein